ncbi:MAG TPA: hypothetical protein VK081_02000 [Planctomycetota bacterium]|nr:hypothetical protein [Planctomycetota bacterium]
MAKSRRKSGAGKRGAFKRKKMNKGYSTVHQPHYLVRMPRRKKAEGEEAGTQQPAAAS